jgi:hypothetical protein
MEIKLQNVLEKYNFEHLSFCASHTLTPPPNPKCAINLYGSFETIIEKGAVRWAQNGPMCKHLKGPTKFGRVWAHKPTFFTEWAQNA